MTIDRQAVVARHDVHVTTPDPQHVLSVGNGDFAFTADITGMQTFQRFHDPLAAMMKGEVAVNTATMSTWAWHNMPNPEGFTLQDAMTTYDTPRGSVPYPGKYDMEAAMAGHLTEEHRAGAWLHTNPQRVDLGRVGLLLRPNQDGAAITDPSELAGTRQSLDLWTGTLRSEFAYQGERVEVVTVASPDDATVAFRITSALLADQRAAVQIAFPYPHDGFFQTDDWSVPDQHQSSLTESRFGYAQIERTADDTRYSVTVMSSHGTVASSPDPHAFALTTGSTSIDVVVTFQPEGVPTSGSDFAGIAARSTVSWESFWRSGAAVDLSSSTDPRAAELERRVVLSQYLTRVHSAGVMPPQETGLVTNSWQGKSHLEMHFWHAAHFAAWGRPELLERSLGWYRQIMPAARATAESQGYDGVRWPKQVGPDGRESPSPIGSLLIWQQPHVLHLLELLWHASSEDRRAALLEGYAELVEATADFMASFAELRDGRFHLGPPVMPAQEFYDAASTIDPTFELSYWWWGLDIASKWQARSGRPARADWLRVQEQLAAPRVVDGRYAAVANDVEARRDDHPSLLAALGVVPPNPLIEPDIMSATLDDVLATWDWHSAWGWDFPMIALTASRLGRTDTAFDALVRDETKNHYTLVGHNPHMGGVLPLYLPGNGSVLLAVARLASDPSLPSANGWTVQAEGFPELP
ncbi:hypothetical protein [Arthrobacter sp. Z1-15]